MTAAYCPRCGRTTYSGGQQLRHAASRCAAPGAGSRRVTVVVSRPPTAALRHVSPRGCIL